MSEQRADAGSYRDPSGQVFLVRGRVLRTVMPTAAADFDFVEASGVLDEMVDEGIVVGSELVAPEALGELGGEAHCVVEHPRLAFVSYPYEWSFGALQAAALCHLDVHLRALDRGVTLSDASAYNIQFRGPKAVFIDRLSFRRYRVGELWVGHRQFCEQFLNPLLLRALLGVSHNAWYRGQLEGISVEETSLLVPWRKKLSWNVLTHVALQARFQKTSTRRGQARTPQKEVKLPRSGFVAMLQGLRKWIARLRPLRVGKTVWDDYADNNSYSTPEAQSKRAFISEFAAALEPALLWDLGCNTGDYSQLALEAGARKVIGFDSDLGALERAFARAREGDLDFLPLFLDAVNPPPSQGWAETERRGLKARAGADALLALAIVHHLAIARNVPLDRVVDWLVGLAPRGVIEFVPKADPMAQELLRFKGDLFPSYSGEVFERELQARARIVRSEEVSSSGRKLYWYDRL